MLRKPTFSIEASEVLWLISAAECYSSKFFSSMEKERIQRDTIHHSLHDKDLYFFTLTSPKKLAEKIIKTKCFKHVCLNLNTLTNLDCRSSVLFLESIQSPVGCPWKAELNSFYVLKSPLRVVKHMQLILVLDMYLPDFKHPLWKMYCNSCRKLVVEPILERNLWVPCVMSLRQTTPVLIYLQNLILRLVLDLVIWAKGGRKVAKDMTCRNLSQTVGEVYEQKAVLIWSVSQEKSNGNATCDYVCLEHSNASDSYNDPAHTT